MNISPIVLHLASDGSLMCPAKVSMKFTHSVSVTFSKPTIPTRRSDVCWVQIALNKLTHGSSYRAFFFSKPADHASYNIPQTGGKSYMCDASACSFSGPAAFLHLLWNFRDSWYFSISNLIPLCICHTFSIIYGLMSKLFYCVRISV